MEIPTTSPLLQRIEVTVFTNILQPLWNFVLTNFYISKSLVQQTIFLVPVTVKVMEKNLNITNYSYSKHILSVPPPSLHYVYIEVPLHELSSTFIHKYPPSSTFVHCHSSSSTLIHLHPPFHFYSLSSTFIHLHPLSFTIIHLNSLSFCKTLQLCGGILPSHILWISPSKLTIKS